MSEVAQRAAQAAALAAEALADEYVALDIDGSAIEVVSMSGREKVSELYRFELVCAAQASDAAPEQLIGKRCTLTLHDGFGCRRFLGGIVAEAGRLVRGDGGAELTVVIRPAVYPLTLSRDSRVFNDMSVPQIVDRVLEKVKAPYRWQLSGSYRERVYTAQYREDDWLFISRLLEEEGIYYWFDHEGEQTVLVFADSSVGAPELVGGAPIEFVTDTGMLGNKELIHEIAAEAHATATKFTVGSFDPWNPALKVMSTEGDGVHEMYDAPAGGPESPAVCLQQARTRLECARSHRASVSGNSSSVRLESGRVVEVLGHPLHDGRYFVTEVLYDVKQRRRFARAAGGYQCHFEAIRSELPFRPPEDSPLAKQAGIQSGRVVGPPGEEIHSDEKGRVRVQLHWDREGGWDDRAGKWMRVAQRGVSMSMLLPRTGWNVMTFMEEGNVDAPTVLSRVHDADHQPSYPLPANKTRTVFKTATSPGGGSSNEFRFEDLAGIQEMFINASRNMNYKVKHDCGHQVGHDHEKKVGGNQTLGIASTTQKDVQNDQSMKVGGNEKLEIVKDRDKNVGGNEKNEVGGDRKLEIGSNISFTVEKDRQLEVSGNATEEAKKGLIKWSSQKAKVNVTGSVEHTLEGVHQEQVTKNAVRDVGAAKSEQCKEGYTVEINGRLTENITGSLMMKTGKHFMDGSDRITVWRVGTALTGTAPHVHVQAKDQILLKVGASTVEITPKNVTILSPAYEVSGSVSTVAVTKRIDHN